jgi:hypothetical protein
MYTSDEYLSKSYILSTRTACVSLTNHSDESDEAILTFNKIQCVDDTDYICGISYDTNGIIHKKQTISTNITVKRK